MFRQLKPSEDVAGHAVWIEAFEWLRSRGIRQWIVPLPYEVFQMRTLDGRNYGFFEDDEIVAVVTLSKFANAHWTEVLGSESRWWLGALAVRNGARGRGVGKQVIALSSALLVKGGGTELYLDCVEGALAFYYASAGFSQRHAKTVTYPSGNAFLMILMSARLPNQALEPTTPAVTIAAAQEVAPAGGRDSPLALIQPK